MKRTVVTVLLTACALCAWSQTQSRPLQVSFPGKSWALVIDAAGFVVESNAAKPDGRQYLLAKNKSTGMVLSITLERNAKGADPNTCPDYLKRNRIQQGLSGFEVENIRYSTVAGMAAVEYFIPSYQGKPVRQQNLVACTAHEDVYVDIHLSKAPSDAKDQSLFTAVMNGMRVVPATSASAPPEFDSRHYMAEGSRLYLQQKYRESIEPYSQALTLEKKERKLEQNMWRVLVDNLAMAYGMTGDLDHAESTLRYGLSVDPTYPMFFYNLACAAAERNDLDNTLLYLKKAFEYKQNAIPGEGMPDPRADDSFQRFLKNPKFEALMESIRR